MKRSLLASLVMVLVAALGVGLSAAPSASAPERGRDRLEVYTATVDPEQLTLLAEQGFDLTEARASGSLTEVSLVMDRVQAARLRAQGIGLKLTRVKGGQTVRQFAAAQAVGGYNVWRSYDEPGGIRDQMYAAAKQNPNLARVKRLGTTAQGREILAVRLTQGRRGHDKGRGHDRGRGHKAKPAVLYSSTQHAREWISTEINRRLMFHYIDAWRANDREVRKLLRSTELWFILVANPDGYQYTFDAERLWRKNLRDNNGDGVTQVGDGVDPNRNFANHWGYDNEGSSPNPSSETYRGPSAGSEPETQAMTKLMAKEKFALQVNWHSAGEWILYPEGWQIGTPSADDPIYYALAGNLDNSAIENYHSGISSDVLYVTNGETTDYAHSTHGTLAFTPELSEGCPGCGFVFPDEPALVQAEFERVLPFAHSAAASAVDPADPTTVTGVTTEPFYLESDDPYKRGLPDVNFTFSESYGDPQPVDVLASKDLRRVRVHYRINGGRERTSRTRPWSYGDRYTPVGKFYERRRGIIRGTDPGDSVEVWFEDRHGQRSDSFTYEAVSETGNRVLIVAAEDYTGASPVQGPGPHYLDYYLDAVRANGEDADVYDIDARRPGRPRRTRRAEPLRRRRLVHRRRHRHPYGGAWGRQRRPARARRDTGDAFVHECRGARALHR